ncbi:hypothetical protein [Altericroceibacterium xinjiangense]|uniref:hypothetical protein n=1 Tax=Altericroceibacterium xinjiangense TaxID=762261 RepID=UPI000F7F352E|nr:hypothetical protein [Altericroceibacterium xinjiangense]
MADNIVPFPRPGANDNHDPKPPQPGLRSFIVYDEMPKGFITHEQAGDQNSPHMREGEFAVIDTSDRHPMQGEMFLVQWMNGNRSIMTTEIIDGWPGWVFSTCRGEMMCNLDGSPDRRVRWVDGPYKLVHAMEKIVGRVVGIYHPDFRAHLKDVV